jgi:hypothetical protein
VDRVPAAVVAQQIEDLASAGLLVARGHAVIGCFSESIAQS